MTHEKRINVSIFTGVLMCDLGAMHNRIEKLLVRPVIAKTFGIGSPS